MALHIKRGCVKLTATMLCLLFAYTPCFAGGLSVAAPELGGGTAAKASSTASATVTVQEPLPTAVEFEKVELSREMMDFIATVDGDIAITVLSSESDLVGGKYFEYYSELQKGDEALYYTALNTLKSIAELNEFVKLTFLDPFLGSGQSFIKRYSSYDLKYGDIFISCYSNFDGNPQTRYEVVELADCFKIKKGTNGYYAAAVCIEDTLLKTLGKLRDSRDINIAYLTDFCAGDTVTELRKYLDGKGYNLDYVAFSNEKLNGYDTVLIAEPVRDISLEELILLDSFLDNGGRGGKSLMYFAPKNNISMPNLHSFLLKWGVDLYGGLRLESVNGDGVFADNTQLYADSLETKWTADTDKTNAFYIMDSCTPIKILASASGVTVTELLKSRAKNVAAMQGESSRDGSTVAFISENGASLATLSQRLYDNGKTSRVAVFASADFLTTYFARQNSVVSPTGYLGNENGNLALVTEVITEINAENAEKASGLLEYALTKSERGLDNTSGIDTGVIMRVGIVAVSVFIAAIAIVLFILNRRTDKCHGRTKIRKKTKGFRISAKKK